MCFLQHKIYYNNNVCTDNERKLHTERECDEASRKENEAKKKSQTKQVAKTNFNIEIMTVHLLTLTQIDRFVRGEKLDIIDLPCICGAFGL